MMRRDDAEGDADGAVRVRGLVSRFAAGCGRAATDRQFFYVNGRPCHLGKVRA